MPKFSLGWRKNRPGVDKPAHHLMQAVKRTMQLDPLPRASLYEFRGVPQLQLNVGACWAFATSRNIQLFLAANEITDDSGQILKDFTASQRKLYYDGRIEEYAGMDPETAAGFISDSGTEPRIGLQAAQRLGIVSLAECPYIGQPGPNNTQPPPVVYENAYDMRDLDYAAVTTAGAQRCADVADALKHRIPSQFGMLVDSAFMDNQGARIASIDGNRIEGGHDIAPLAVMDTGFITDFGNELGLPHDTQPGDVLFDNWWDPGDGSLWGNKRGLGVMSAGLFGSTWISDIYLIQGVPLVRKAA